MREVGYELYQSMLEEAIAKIRAGELEGLTEADGPMGAADQPRRAGADPRGLRARSRRAAGPLPPPRRRCTTKVELEGFAAELIDRFGKLPQGGQHAAADRADQGDVQARRHRAARRRAEGRDDPVPQRQVRLARRAGRVHPGPERAGQGQGQQDRRPPRLGATKPTRSRAPSPSRAIWPRRSPRSGATRSDRGSRRLCRGLRGRDRVGKPPCAQPGFARFGRPQPTPGAVGDVSFAAPAIGR